MLALSGNWLENGMSEREEDILKKVLETQERHTSILETIRRGVYGDAENNVLGLLQRSGS
jgi:hypothetical protein